MIKAYAKEDDVLVAHDLPPGTPLPEGTVWIDLLEPTPEEDAHIESLGGIGIPTRDEMTEIEESSRFYSENGALYLTAPVLFRAGTDNPGLAPITFVVTEQYLITVRYTTPQSVAHFIARVSKAGNNLVSTQCNPVAILFGLFEAITDRLADVLESAAQRLDGESNRLITGANGKKPMSTPSFRSGLTTIGKEGEFLSKARESLAGISRLLAYVHSNMPSEEESSQNRMMLESLERDIRSLTDHVAFLSERTIFLLDTVVGLVSVEQNAIIKIFSVVAVVFMPPTLVASIYGMNFRHMPELDWLLGYPWAIGLMVASALLPLLYFRGRGWL